MLVVLCRINRVQMDVRGMKFEKLSFLNSYFEELLDAPGMYHWVYWPSFDASTIKVSELELLLIEYSGKCLSYSEPFQGKYKFHGEIKERLFPDNGNMFGLPDKKALELRQYLTKRGNVVEFAGVFQELCFGRPFYIGKANNLRSRLKQHFARSGSEILDSIDRNTIPYSDIWVGQKIVADSIAPNINNIFEEIFSRVFKPGLTIKPN